MTQSNAIVTRFAPSPTGYLHIGSARTALFSWLYARHHQGRFLLRIEDTDKERSTQEAIDAIYEGMEWLGLTWDGDVLLQSTRAEVHVAVAETLLQEGKAYKCYATPEELAEMRETARKEGRSPKYDGRWRDRDPSEAPDDVRPAIRLKAPQDGVTVIKDHVQGDVRIDNATLDDMVLLRSDGTPTYMLAVVVDDHDMGVTDVVRGDDHLINAARQIQIFEAMGWPVPEYAHVPLIHGSDGAKMSKRHGSIGVAAYRDMGYLPEAMRNYLARLGWSHGDDEIFSTEQAIEWFDLNDINKAPARFDLAKLDHINAHYLREAGEDRLISDLTAVMTGAKGWTVTDEARARIKTALPALRDRAKTLVEMAEDAYFLIAERPISVEPASAKHLTDDSRDMLKRLKGDLEVLSDWSHDGVETAIRAFVTRESLKFGAVGQPLRAATTGTPKSPGLFDVLAALGKTETLARIDDQIGG